MPSCLSIALNADIQLSLSLCVGPRVKSTTTDYLPRTTAKTAVVSWGFFRPAHIIASNDNLHTPAWEALQFFTYSAIILNLTGAFISLVSIRMCVELPLRAQRAVLACPDSWPARIVGNGEVLPTDALTSHYALLETFGMSK